MNFLPKNIDDWKIDLILFYVPIAYCVLFQNYFTLFIILFAYAAIPRKIGSKERPKQSAPKSVAIIGGGIAGVGAAFAIARSSPNNKVTIYEKNAVLGGNAKTHTWKIDNPDKKPNIPSSLTTGLSVLAWPATHFRNYNNFLQDLAIQTQDVELKFFVKDLKRSGIFAHNRTSEMSKGFAADVEKWNKFCAHIIWMKKLLGANKSFYDFSFVNPWNIIPLRFGSSLFGISQDFYDTVIVSIYSSTFLTVNMSYVPAVMAPIIDELIPLSKPGVMRTWTENSAKVFSKVLENYPNITVVPNAQVTSVEKQASGEVAVSEKTTGSQTKFDHVVFACPSRAVAELLQQQSPTLSGLLGKIDYCDDDDVTFNEGLIHQDMSVLPKDHAQDLRDNFCNYIEVFEDPKEKKKCYTNVFIISSWVPSAKEVKKQGLLNDAPFLVSYNFTADSKPRDEKVVGRVTNLKAHPHLTLKNMILARLVSFFQGTDNFWYCGSYTTPGNGHDLSLLSGFAVANQIGCNYPFTDPSARTDFFKLAGMMGLSTFEYK